MTIDRDRLRQRRGGRTPPKNPLGGGGGVALIFETSSDCGPFLICTSVFSQAPGSRIFFLLK